MTPKDAARVLAEMTATWPQRELSPPEVQLWVDEFRPLRAETTLTAIRELRKVCDWLPTHSQFVFSYQAVSRREAMEQTAIPESTGAVSSRDRALAAIAEARFILNTTSRKKAE